MKIPLADLVTTITSHEIVEAATHPSTHVKPAYEVTDDVAWTFALNGGELADLCSQGPDARIAAADLGGAQVQRIWSNQGAAGSHWPCLPAAPSAGPYFNAAPALLEPLTFTDPSTSKSAQGRGLSIPAGGSKTIEIDPFSDGPTAAPWKIEAVDLRTLSGLSPELTLALDAATASNGDKLHLTVTVNQKDATGYETLVLISKLGSATNFWPIVVQTP